MDVFALAQQCAPNVAPQTMVALAHVESSHNPFAIGVVGGALQRQPKNETEAVATARALEAKGRNFSMGIVQVNRYNLPKYGLTYAEVFKPCENLRVGGLILEECYRRAVPRNPDPQRALRAAFSCYYSGNFSRGFKPDRQGEPSYVQKVVNAAGVRERPQLKVPAVAGSIAPEPSRGGDDGLVVFIKPVTSTPALVAPPAEPVRVAVIQESAQPTPLPADKVHRTVPVDRKEEHTTTLVF